MTRGRVAVVHPKGVALDERPAIRKICGSECDDLVHLCFEATHFDLLRATADNPAFIFTPLDPPVDLLLVLPQTQGLFPNTLTAAWLGTLLAHGEAREIRIAHDGPGGPLIAALRVALPPAVFDEPDEDWVRLRLSADLAQHIADLPSSYGWLHGVAREFREVLGGPKNASYWRHDIDFGMQLHHASRHSVILEHLADRLDWGQQPRLLDIGGAYGCLGLEMATKGWSVAVVDKDPTKTELRGPWLRQWLKRPLSIDFCTMAMEDTATSALLGDNRDWEAITFFLSLCMAKRENIPGMLRACWQKLAPGGALLIHEYVPQHYVDDFTFDRDQLIAFIAENAAPPENLFVFDGKPSNKFTGTLLAVKPRSDAS